MAVIVTIFAYGLQLGALLFLPALLFFFSVCDRMYRKRPLSWHPCYVPF